MIRVLIIDDEDTVRLLYQKELENDGWQVCSVADAAAAVATLEQEEFDAIILDIEMPDINGLELLPQLREIAPNTRIILNTAYSVYKTDFHSWLADGYLVKSSDLTELKQKIKELVE